MHLCGMQFAPDCWVLCHMRRVRLQGFLIEWVPTSNTTVLDILGLGTENLDDEVALNKEPDITGWGDE